MTSGNFGALLRSAAVSSLAMVLSVANLNAQATATITGIVTDPSGAAIADATIQARNTGTGITQTVTTDGAGRYTIPQLDIGDYEVKTSKSGFATVTRNGVTLTVGAQPVIDFQLPVGQEQRTVIVEASATQVETQPTAVGALVETKQITELPLNGRNYTQLRTLAPGVTQIPFGAPGAGTTFYDNGQKIHNRRLAPIGPALSAG